jgi:hypothetical protein
VRFLAAAVPSAVPAPIESPPTARTYSQVVDELLARRT